MVFPRIRCRFRARKRWSLQKEVEKLTEENAELKWLKYFDRCWNFFCLFLTQIDIRYFLPEGEKKQKPKKKVTTKQTSALRTYCNLFSIGIRVYVCVWTCVAFDCAVCVCIGAFGATRSTSSGRWSVDGSPTYRPISRGSRMACPVLTDTHRLKFADRYFVASSVGRSIDRSFGRPARRSERHAQDTRARHTGDADRRARDATRQAKGVARSYASSRRSRLSCHVVVRGFVSFVVSRCIDSAEQYFVGFVRSFVFRSLGVLGALMSAMDTLGYSLRAKLAVSV